MGNYRVEGNYIRGYCILTAEDGIEYDLLESKTEAEEICDVLNSGIGPEWDAVEAELRR